MKLLAFLVCAMAPAVGFGLRPQFESPTKNMMLPAADKTGEPSFLQAFRRPFAAITPAARQLLQGRAAMQARNVVQQRVALPAKPPLLPPIQKPRVLGPMPFRLPPMSPKRFPFQPFGRPQPRQAANALARGADSGSTDSTLPLTDLPASWNMLQTQKEAKRSIVEVMKLNIRAKEHEQVTSGPKAQRPLERVIRDAMVAISGGNGDKIMLLNVKDSVTESVILPKCEATIEKVLGVGGVGIVMKLNIVDESAKKVLQANAIAVKVIYHPFEKENPQSDETAMAAQFLQDTFEQELKPTRDVTRDVAGKVGKAKATAREISEKNQWALPLWTASVGSSTQREMYVHQGFGFLNETILSPVMLGSENDFFFKRPNGMPGARLTMAAKELACAQMIASTARLHDAGMAHQDVKPENFLVSANGNVFLADFGMSGPLNQPRPCQVMLTPLYMDPQHAKCFRSNGVEYLNKAYDTWATGQSCFMVFTNGVVSHGIGRQPTMGSLVQHISDLTHSRERNQTQAKTPEEDLRSHGVSEFWSRVVGSMLNTPRQTRPTLQDITEKYSSIRNSLNDTAKEAGGTN